MPILPTLLVAIQITSTAGPATGAHQQNPSAPARDTEDVAALRPRAEKGDAEAQTDLGDAYYHGRGVPQDLSQAVGWWRKAADQGYAPAQFHLGLSYSFGEGVPKDATQAAVWWRKAAEQGDWRAQASLGDAYADGRGVPRDAAEAQKWHDLSAVGINREGAEQGEAGMQWGLGSRYAQGQGVPQNDALAVVWYRKAAAQGFRQAQFDLGEAYSTGRGVAKDAVEALTWYSLASERRAEDDRLLSATDEFSKAVAARLKADQQKFRNARDALARQMPPEQRAEAYNRAKTLSAAVGTSDPVGPADATLASPLKGKVADGTYTSQRGLLRVPVPTASNWARVPFTVQEQSEAGERNFDAVFFYVKDFGEVLSASVRRIPRTVLDEMAKSDPHDVLKQLADKALVDWRQGFTDDPVLVEEDVVPTRYGQAAIRIYRVPKGSLLQKIVGGSGKGPESVDVMIAVIAAKRNDQMVSAIAENDAEPMERDRLRTRLEQFFSGVVVPEVATFDQ